jgi:hypothetical protein
VNVNVNGWYRRVMPTFSRTADLRLEQKRVDQLVADHLVSLIPVHWTRVDLVLEFTFGENGRITINTLITSPEGNTDRVQPTQAFLDATHRLLNLAQRSRRRLRKARYTLQKKTDASWEHRVKCEYL